MVCSAPATQDRVLDGAIRSIAAYAFGRRSDSFHDGVLEAVQVLNEQLPQSVASGREVLHLAAAAQRRSILQANERLTPALTGLVRNAAAEEAFQKIMQVSPERLKACMTNLLASLRELGAPRQRLFNALLERAQREPATVRDAIELIQDNRRDAYVAVRDALKDFNDRSVAVEAWKRLGIRRLGLAPLLVAIDRANASTQRLHFN